MAPSTTEAPRAAKPAPPASTAAIVLAAGKGSRFAGANHKLLSQIRGRPVVGWAVQAAVDAGFETVFVVTGAVKLDGVLPKGVKVVPNPEWSSGQASSLQAGIAAAAKAGCDAAVVGLGDQPFIGPGPWRAVAAAAYPIAVATYDGQRWNPVRLDRSVWELLPTRGDTGARSVIAVRPDLVGEVPCQGEPIDIDSVEDLEPWN